MSTAAATQEKKYLVNQILEALSEQFTLRNKRDEFDYGDTFLMLAFRTLPELRTIAKKSGVAPYQHA